MTQFSLTSAEVAALLNAELIGPPDLKLTSLAGIDEGGPGSITFIRSAEFASRWLTSDCSAALVSKNIGPIQGHDPASRVLFIVDSADLAMVTLLEKITPPTHLPELGAHTTATVDPSATVHPAARLGPLVVIGPRTVVGAHSTLAAGVVLGADCRIGEHTTLRPGIVIEDRCTIGNRCILHPHVAIGGDGFGFVPREDGRGVIKIPHAGIVEIQDDVEIGSTTSIDRGKFGATTIGQGSKIDSQCQIGHNVIIGRSCLICGACAIGGSTTLEDGVIIGGQVGIADNLTLGAGCNVGAGSGIFRSIPAGEKWIGYPAGPSTIVIRGWTAIRKLPGIIKNMPRTDSDPSSK